MNTPLSTDFAQRYAATLQRDLAAPALQHSTAAQDLGREAVELHLETLDLARIHVQALLQLIPAGALPGTTESLTIRAASFFTEALIPIEATHPPAQETSADLKQTLETLNQRTEDLAGAHRDLQTGVQERLSAEAALAQSQQKTATLLQDSQALEKDLRHITRSILSTNEAERKKMSHQLTDEIAQNLLGIHIRLLALNRRATDNQEGLTKEIVNTQGLVQASIKTIHQLVHQFNNP